MRLTPAQLDIIRSTVAEQFGSNAHVWLFGSRADDSKRGGDVDLYIETNHPALPIELRCKSQLQEKLDLHVDLVIQQPGNDTPISQIAKNTGVSL